MSRGQLLRLIERLQWADVGGWQACQECGAYGPVENGGGVHKRGCQTQQAIDELRGSGDLHCEVV